jgi:hypothetical protein
MTATPSTPQKVAPTGVPPGESAVPLRHGSDALGASRGRQADLTSVAWVAAGELSYDEWLRQGRRLGVVGRSAAWWIGDWVRYGAARYGRKYELATRVTGYEHQTLLNMVYVAARFEISRRREKLSWSHHADLAAFDVAEQERWLDRAAAQRLTVRQLRCELMAARRSLETPPANTGVAASEQQRQSVEPKPTPDSDPLDQLERSRARDGRSGRVLSCPRCGHVFTDSNATSDLDAPSHATVAPSPASDYELGDLHVCNVSNARHGSA